MLPAQPTIDRLPANKLTRRVPVLLRASLCCACGLLANLLLPLIAVAGLPVPVGQSFQTRDSLAQPEDSNPDALICLHGLCWPPAMFHVDCEPPADGEMQAMIRFPSPRPIGHAQSDRVALEWYAAVDAQGHLQQAPAVIVVHESGSGMTVGRIVSRGLQARGLHALMLQLPYYGLRRPPGQRPEGQNIASLMGQGIADARRALDAVRALPGIDPGNVAIIGISLGGFVSATAAGLDGTFDHVFILLAGGNLPRLVATGERETAQLRRVLESQGYHGERLAELLNQVEPNRLAHRIDAASLWVYSATMDTVVPPDHAADFARAAGLQESHHQRFPATHYSGILFLPAILDQVTERITSRNLESQ